jgi:hypothetical protein
MAPRSVPLIEQHGSKDERETAEIEQCRALAED